MVQLEESSSSVIFCGLWACQDVHRNRGGKSGEDSDGAVGGVEEKGKENLESILIETLGEFKQITVSKKQWQSHKIGGKGFLQ